MMTSYIPKPPSSFVTCFALVCAVMVFTLMSMQAEAGSLGGVFSNFGAGSGSANGDGVKGFCATHSTGPADNAILIGKIIPCMEQIILKTTIYMNASISTIVYPIVAAVLTLFIVLYGISILRGEGELTKRGIIFIFKVAAVMAFTNGLGGYIPDAFAVLSEMQEYAASGLEAFASGENCPDIEKYGSSGAMISPVWRNMDCTLGKLFGIGAETTLASSVFGILGAAVFSGTMGAQIFFMGIFALASMMMLVIRAAYTYMTTYIYLAFLIIISPFFIPLLSGSGQVFQIFDRFIKSFISAFMVPVFLFGYLVLAMTMIDSMLFSPGSAGGLEMSETFQELIDESNKTHMAPPTRRCDVNILKDAHTNERVGAAKDSTWLDGIGGDIMNSFMSGAASLCNFSKYSLDLSDDQMKDLLFDFLKIAVVIYLLIEVMNIVLDIAQQTLMGAYALVNAAEKTNMVEGTVMGALGGARDATQDTRYDLSAKLTAEVAKQTAQGAMAGLRGTFR